VLGLDTFGDVTRDEDDRPRSHAQTIRNVVEQGVGATRCDLKYGMGGLSHDALMTNIDLYGTQVIPRVRDLLADREPAAGRVTAQAG
jgi:hypothetical protein